MDIVGIMLGVSLLVATLFCVLGAIILSSHNNICLCLFNDPIDKTCNEILKESLESGIKTYDTDEFFLRIEFNNGTLGYLWNKNKPYAWVNEGFFKFPDGEVYEWRLCRPSRKTLIKLDKALKHF